MDFQDRLKKLRGDKKLTQQDVANKLGITRQAYGHYENKKAKREPDIETIKKLAAMFDVSVDYLLSGRPSNNVTVAGKEIVLSEEEYLLFNELKKHPIMLHDLASNPEEKVKELIKLYKMKKMFFEDDEEDPGDGFGEFED